MLTIIVHAVPQAEEWVVRSSRRDRTLPSIYCPAKMENKKPCVYKSFTFIQRLLSLENCCVCGLTMTTKDGQMQHMKVIITTKLTTCSII